jgi:hypothetical protein
MACRGGACLALYCRVQGFALPFVPCLGGASPTPTDHVVTPAKAGGRQIFRGVYRVQSEILRCAQDDK